MLRPNATRAVQLTAPDLIVTAFAIWPDDGRIAFATKSGKLYTQMPGKDPAFAAQPEEQKAIDDEVIPVTGEEIPMDEGKAPAEKGVNDGKGFCFISHVGDVYPSGFLQLCGGNVRETTLSAIYRDSELFRSLRDPSLLQGKCGRCEFKDVCGGSRARAWATSGSHLAEEPCCTYQPGSAA